MADISVGTLTQSGTTTLVTGTTSGMDTNALVEIAVNANNEKADTLDIKVDDNLALISGYEELYGLAQGVQDSLETLKSITGYSGEDSNVFEQRTANLSSSGADVSGILTATIEESAVEDSYQIVVQQKAEAFSVGSNAVTDKAAALGSVGSFSIGLEGGAASQIDVTADMSLQDLMDSINAQSDVTNIKASIIKVSETDYQLTLTGEETNKDIEVTTASGSVLQDLGFVDGSDAFAGSQIIQNAQGSVVTLNGATITREDNVYDDLIEGVSFTIEGADPASTITLEVSNDVTSAKDAILAFVDAYNALRDFVVLNQQVNADGSVSDDAPLFSDSLMETLSYQVSNLLTGSAINGGTLTNMRDLGIVFDDNNKLVVDDELQLDEALLNNFDDIHNFFTTDVDISSSQLGLITNTSSQTVLDFTLDIKTDANGDIVSVTANGDPSAFEIKDNRLVGKSGTAYEGLSFAYAGEEDASISVYMQAGLADRLFNIIEGYTDTAEGLIQQEINALKEQNEDFETEAEEIRTRGEEIRERQIEKYSEMEAKLASLESLRNLIQALLGNDEE